MRNSIKNTTAETRKLSLEKLTLTSFLSIARNAIDKSIAGKIIMAIIKGTFLKR